MNFAIKKAVIVAVFVLFLFTIPYAYACHDGVTADFCGDGLCGGDVVEDCVSCPEDCGGACIPGEVFCYFDTRQTCSSSCQWENTEDCATKTSTDSDGSATAYTTAGKVTDYLSCSSGKCTNTTYSDSCSATTLTEYAASGSTFTSAKYDCQNYETNYCSGTSVYTEQWGCSGSPAYCNDAAVADTLVEDCATKLSTDSDGSATAYNVSGTVTDYTSCSGGSCTSTSYTDFCSGTLLTERGASGSSYTSSTFECQNYETNYCSADRYYKDEWGCSSNKCTNTTDTAIGTNADNDAKDKECGDSLCDNAAGVYDSTKTATETNCADSLDNDCDGAIDCADSDCSTSSVSGTVKNDNNQLVSSADISVKKDLTEVYSATTNSQGIYTISSVGCGFYNIVASHPDYAPATKSINITLNQQATIDFTLFYGTSCEEDCTFVADNIIHASCDNKNGCSFYDRAGNELQRYTFNDNIISQLNWIIVPF